MVKSSLSTLKPSCKKQLSTWFFQSKALSNLNGWCQKFSANATKLINRAPETENLCAPATKIHAFSQPWSVRSTQRLGESTCHSQKTEKRTANPTFRNEMLHHVTLRSRLRLSCVASGRNRAAMCANQMRPSSNLQFNVTRMRLAAWPSRCRQTPFGFLSGTRARRRRSLTKLPSSAKIERLDFLVAYRTPA